MKCRVMTLGSLLLAILSVTFFATSIQLYTQVSRQNELILSQAQTIDELAAFAVSKAYLTRLIPPGSIFITNAQYLADFVSTDALTASFLQDVYLADLALEQPLSEQHKFEFLACAYAGYEMLQWNPALKSEWLPVPELDWSTMDTLKAGFDKADVHRLPRDTGYYLWIGIGQRIDGITGASGPFPSLRQWTSFEDFNKDFEDYRFRKIDNRNGNAKRTTVHPQAGLRPHVMLTLAMAEELIILAFPFLWLFALPAAHPASRSDCYGYRIG